MTRTFRAATASTTAARGRAASPVDGSVATTASVPERSPTASVRSPTDESPMRSRSPSPRSSASRTPSSYSSRSSRSPSSSSRSAPASPTRASSGASTVTRYGEWSDGHAHRGAAQPTRLGHKKRPLQSEGKSAAKRQRTQRMTEHFFQHSSGLLRRATLENDTRAGDLDHELRRQHQKLEKYERKIRSLRRELEALNPEAAAAFDAGELRPTELASDAPGVVGETSRPTDVATESLLPPHFVQREAALRTSLQDRRALFSSFKSLLKQSHSTA